MSVRLLISWYSEYAGMYAYVLYHGLINIIGPCTVLYHNPESCLFLLCTGVQVRVLYGVCSRSIDQYSVCIHTCAVCLVAKNIFTSRSFYENYFIESLASATPPLSNSATICLYLPLRTQLQLLAQQEPSRKTRRLNLAPWRQMVIFPSASWRSWEP